MPEMWSHGSNLAYEKIFMAALEFKQQFGPMYLKVVQVVTILWRQFAAISLSTDHLFGPDDKSTGHQQSRTMLPLSGPTSQKTLSQICNTYFQYCNRYELDFCLFIAYSKCMVLRTCESQIP